MRDTKVNFSVLAKVGLAIENVTKGYVGKILTISDHEITVNWIIGGSSTSELTVNGGFELGSGDVFTGWSVITSENDTVTETSTAHNGSRAVKITYVDGITDTKIYYFGAEGYNLEWTPGDLVSWEF